MASEKKSEKKRPLPAWMKALHNQSNQNSNTANEHEASGSEFKGASNGKRQKGAFQSSEIATDCKKFKSASEIISDAMPFLKVPGRITYVFQNADCLCVCDEIITSLDTKDKVPVGFDMEWPVSFTKGSQDKTALIQMYFSNLKTCYLFQVSAMNPFPKQLTRLILHGNLILLGLNIQSDLWKLERDFDIRVKPLIDRGNVIDVGRLANEKLKSSERWDLNGLCENVVSMRLNKDFDIRGGNWTDIPLSPEQISYASTDAYAGLLLFENLNEN